MQVARIGVVSFLERIFTQTDDLALLARDLDPLLAELNRVRCRLLRARLEEDDLLGSFLVDEVN